MSPIATQDLSSVSVDPIPSLKARVADSHAAVNNRKPVADNYMYDFKYNAPLPFIGKEAIEVDDSTVQTLSESFATDLCAALKNKDANAFSALFLPNGQYQYGLYPQMYRLTSRCMARQSRLHLGVSYFQRHRQHYTGSSRFTSFDQGLGRRSHFPPAQSRETVS
jgi:hypothetical protein